MGLMLIAFALIMIIDLIPIIKRRLGHDAATFLILFATALTLAVLQVSGIEVSSILLLLGDALKSLGLSY